VVSVLIAISALSSCLIPPKAEAGMEKRRPNLLAFFDQQQVTRIVAYYVILAVLVFVLHQVAPGLPVFSTENFRASVAEVNKNSLLEGTAPLSLTSGQVAVNSLLMMASAVLLMLPVAWVHILTRSRKGFSQSMVQTLIMLPLVVAGVLTIVQHSVALAFSLGGVVGAVSFRNRLADPKDAIYIFLAIAVGIAAGVQVLSVAAALSIFFNLVVLGAWYFDFGRMPAMLEANVAQKRLDRVKSRGAGTPSMRGDFMKVLDQQLLQSMTPDQLQALAERASERHRKAVGREEEDAEPWEKKPKFDAVLRISIPAADATPLRQSIETVLQNQSKRWALERAEPERGGQVVARYLVRFGKSMPGPLVIEAIRRAVLPRTVTIDVLDV
jgi:hypothetical protein